MELPITWRYTIGIDISKKLLEIYLYDRKTRQGTPLQVANTPEGFDRLGRWLAGQDVQKSQAVLCSEHTGRYGEQLLGWTTRSGWLHAPVKTTALEKVTEEHHRKSDRYDARKLAEYARRYSDRLRLSAAPKPAVGQLRRLQAERRKMVDRRAALKSKCSEASAHAADMSQLLQMWDQQIALLTKHITQLEQRMDRIIEEHPGLHRRYRPMRSAPGMGPVLGRFWLSEFAARPELNPRKIASRFGFAPHSYGSGSSVGKPDRSSGYGNSEMRRLMHQAALSVKTHCPHYNDYYRRKRAEGKPHLLVINNIINKLLRLYCAMWNSRATYDPNHIRKMNEKARKPA